MYVKAIFVLCGSILLAQYSSANCIGAGLSKNLALAELAEAELTGAEILNAKLANAAQLANARLEAVECANAKLAEAELANARLASAEVASARLAAAELANAQLANAELANARLASAELANAKLASSELANARLAAEANARLAAEANARFAALYPLQAAGGSFSVVSSSPNAPTGVSIFSENTIEGPLQVVGSLPVIANVQLDGSVPSTGAAGTAYTCGDGNVGISGESLAAAGVAVGLRGISGVGYAGNLPGYAGNLAQAELAGARYAGNLARAELAGAELAGNLARAELSGIGNLARAELANAQLVNAEIAAARSLGRSCA